MKHRDAFLLLLLGAIWGASYLFMRLAAPALGPAVLMAARVSIAAIALWLYGAAIANLPDWRAHWRKFLMLGLLNNAIPFTLIGVAVIYLNASIAAILNATTPFFTAIVATLWLGEAFGLRRLIGIVLGIAGVTILVGWSPLPLNVQTLTAAGAALLAAFSYGVATVYARDRFVGVQPLHTAIGQLTGSTLLLVPLAVFQLPNATLTLPIALAVLALALVCTAFAYLLFFELIASAGATQAASVTFLVPMFSVLWGVLLLGEPLSTGMLVGLAVILASVWLVLGTGPLRPRKRLRARATP
jgi:drug/metabolite transporter (DMT)-like permease